jgi:hypothetical protein
MTNIITIGSRVKVVDDMFIDVIGNHNKTGKLGTVVENDGTELMPIWVQLDGDPKGDTSCFDLDELELAENYPSAPATLVILQHLQKVGNISGIEASSLYKCRALPRRIKDLKDLGWPITSSMRKDATGQRYVRYELAK